MKIKLSRHRFRKNQLGRFLGHSSVLHSDIFSIFYSKQSPSSYAFVCAKKLGSAPLRNKIKRQLKEAFALLSCHVQPDISLVIMAKKKIMQSTFKNTHDMLLLHLKKKRIINDNN